MILEELSERDLRGLLKGPGLCLAVGPFSIRVRFSDCNVFAPSLRLLYSDFPVLSEGPAEFRVQLVHPISMRRWFRSQIIFRLDEIEPFYPFPSAQAFPLYEWGLNWCIYTHVAEFLLLHAAVLERDGQALLMPAAPGSGKSTLTAALVHLGWRLLSDEFALIDQVEGLVHPIPRPVGLKQASIPLIREYAPELHMGPVFMDTRKGAIAHMRPPTDAVKRMYEPARPRWMVFPSYSKESATELAPISKARAFIAASDSSFNYKTLGEAGFDHLSRLIDRCDVFELGFSELEAAAEALSRLENGFSQ